MRRADRLFQLVQLLRRTRLTTADALAGELSVSVRTVYRDIADLAASGVPVRGEPGIGYALDKSYELPPLAFGTTELEALVLGARMVQAFGDRELSQAARSVLAKVEGVVPKPLRDAVAQVPLFAPRHSLAARRARGDRASADLAVLRRAISERRRLEVDYTRADGETSSRVIRPVGLFFWGDRWSVAAWCELRGDYRSFRPDRIERSKLLEAYPVADGVSLDAFLLHTANEDSGGPL